jgi:DNA repair protein RadC
MRKRGQFWMPIWGQDWVPIDTEADLSMTKEIQKGCKYLGLTLHDHIIVGAGTELSLRALGKL